MIELDGPQDGFAREEYSPNAKQLSTSLKAVITTDLRGTIAHLNAHAELLTGWSQAEAFGQRLDTVFDISELTFSSFFADPGGPGDSVALEFSDTFLTAKDRTGRSVEGSAVRIGTDRELSAVLIIFRDATEHSMREEQIRSELSFAQGIIGSILDPFLIIDKALTVKTANHAFYQTFRASSAETEGLKLGALGTGQWAKRDVDRMLNAMISGQATGGSCYVEEHFAFLGKRVMFLRATWLEPLPLDTPSNLILLTIEDVTESHYAERALRSSELRYRRLFESAKDGILILDAETLVIVDANRFIANLLGYSHGELMGRELWEIGFFDDKSKCQAAYSELQHFGYVRYDCLPLETKTGERADVEFISNVYLVAGQAIAQCNIRDISERVRMEQALKEQTTALTELHRRKDEFLAMLSHELRNPLAPITNAVRLLRLQDSQDATMNRACVIIERQLVQMTRLVDDLVEVSRITSGRVQLRSELVTIQEIIEHALETTRPLLNQRKHELSISLGNFPIWLHGDSSRLEQAVVNLLANAAKYTDEGGRIGISAELEENTCVLRVSDTGVGIAQELLPHIFELFTQAERSLDRSRGGLGIGLALVKRIVELHGGTINVHSVLDRGTEFVVRLPASTHAAVLSPTVPDPPRSHVLGSLRVLVVDDNVDTAESMTMLVEMLGHTVKTEHDGSSALQTAFDFRPDVVLLDIGLPGLNGYEVASRIRQQPSLNNTVIVAITGYGHESDRQLAIQAGIDHHLVKPVDFDRVRRILLTASEDRLPTMTD
ncbi:ATP-binding protein [Caballeronia sp. LjRoot29]|uniref:PAS domain-containing hybrid sensor histidine kinase/response regulator n=1 Tax=Caballeronia sp. LjRoot29 TaxID=3342315 RepID=UPI003ECEC37D